MLEEQAPWLSLAVSVLLCLAGAILVDQRANLARWHASTARGFSQHADRIGTAHDVAAPNPAHAMQLLFIVGTVSLGAGAFLMALTILWAQLEPFAVGGCSTFIVRSGARCAGLRHSVLGCRGDFCSRKATAVWAYRPRRYVRGYVRSG